MIAPDPSRIRVLLVGDQILVREGLRVLLERAGDIDVVGEAANGADAVHAAEALGPGIVLLDLDISTDNGFAVVTALAALDKPPRVLALTATHDSDLHRRAIRLGAAGIVLKHSTGEMLVKAVRRVQAGEVWVDRATASRIFEDYRNQGAAAKRAHPDAARVAELRPRERKIIALVAQGVTTHQLAQRLGITEKTVRNHLASIYDKLGVHDRLALAIYAARHGLVESNKGSGT